jgi:hypothetical protein
MRRVWSNVDDLPENQASAEMRTARRMAGLLRVSQTSINNSAVTTTIDCCFQNELLAVVHDYAIAAAAVFVNGCDRAADNEPNGRQLPNFQIEFCLSSSSCCPRLKNVCQLQMSASVLDLNSPIAIVVRVTWHVPAIRQVLVVLLVPRYPVAMIILDVE